MDGCSDRQSVHLPRRIVRLTVVRVLHVLAPAHTVRLRKKASWMADRLPMYGESATSVDRHWPFAAKGFRPFFLLSALFAILILPLWLLALDGRLYAGTYLDPVYWHAHEMIFGFAVAVIAGFLLTAVGNWTKRETAVGLPLLALAALWVAGRVVLTSPPMLPGWLIALVDLAFLPALMIAIARPLIATRNTRNLVMLGILAALFVANLVVHLDVLGVLPGWRRRGCVLGIEVVVLVILVMAGRTFPMFTRNATGVASIASSPWLDRLAIGAMAALILLDLVLPDHAVTAGWAAGAGVITLARTWRWGARHAARTPLLWILHVGYLWIPIGFVLRALARFTSVVPPQLGMHALTVGAIGSLTLGMMARVALGHTGRLLVASRLIVAAFALITLAAMVRVFGPLVVGMTGYRPTLFLAGSLWTAAFLLFLLTYVPILIAPRIDHKPG
jgi:uncharacterized protein involved in response to NO